jgi:hypothetical protein
MEFKWSFPKIKGINLFEPMRDQIVEIGWVLSYGDKSAAGTVTLPKPDPNNFKAYPALLNEDYQRWVEEVLGQDRVEQIKSELKGNTHA